MINAGSFLLGLLVGLAGMAVETGFWMMSWKKDRKAYNSQLRRRETIIARLLDSNEKLKGEIKRCERDGLQ